MDRRRTEITDASVETYDYRPKLWVEWCEDQGIESVSDPSDWTFEQFESYRAGLGLAPSSLHNEMETLQGHIDYLERIEAVEDGLAEKVHVPDVPRGRSVPRYDVDGRRCSGVDPALSGQ